VRTFLKKQGSLFVSCTPTATLRSVFQALVTYRLHRMFVVDDNKIPITVITLSDILANMMTVKESK
jgi:CBS domain-containing protein